MRLQHWPPSKRLSAPKSDTGTGVLTRRNLGNFWNKSLPATEDGMVTDCRVGYTRSDENQQSWLTMSSRQTISRRRREIATCSHCQRSAVCWEARDFDDCPCIRVARSANEICRLNVYSRKTSQLLGDVDCMMISLSVLLQFPLGT